MKLLCVAQQAGEIAQEFLLVRHPPLLEGAGADSQDHPGYDWPYANLANLLIKRGEYRKAFDLGVEAARRNPSSARNYYLTAKALSYLDQLDLSVKWLKQSIGLDPDYAEPHYLLAQVYRRKGLTEEGQQELKAFQDITAKQPQALDPRIFSVVNCE